MDELTVEERRALETLTKLEAIWPKTLWVFAASGSFLVMRKTPNNKIAMDGDAPDQRYMVESFRIECDGGDF